MSVEPTNAELDATVIELDAGMGVAMMNEVHKFLGRFIIYPNEHAHTAHALWCVHTHLMPQWETTPRIAFLSPEPASGKSRALEMTEHLVPNPVTAVNVSPAYLFRKIGCDEGVTILYDEIDTVFGPKAKDNEEIRGLLNAGHRRGAVAGRCVIRGKNIETEEIPAYSAVALAGLGWLPDTILSRSIVIRMKRRRPAQKVEGYRRRIHGPQGEAIKHKIQTWAAGAVTAFPDMPPEIEDRDADVWEPLIAVADAVGGDWPARARVTAVTLVTAFRDKEPSLGIKLLSDVRTAFANLDFMASKDLLAELVRMDESPWGDMHGRELDQRGLAKRLSEYEIRPGVVRQPSGTIRGYRRTDFVEAWETYVPTSAATDQPAAKYPPSIIVRDNVATTDSDPADQWQFNREDDPDAFSIHNSTVQPIRAKT